MEKLINLQNFLFSGQHSSLVLLGFYGKPNFYELTSTHGLLHNILSLAKMSTTSGRHKNRTNPFGTKKTTPKI